MEDSKVKEHIEETVIDDPIVYEYADAYLTCHKCGAEFKLFENVKGGMRVDLYTTDQHKLILHCTECDNKMEIGFKEASNPPVEENTKENDEELTKNTKRDTSSETATSLPTENIEEESTDSQDSNIQDVPQRDTENEVQAEVAEMPEPLINN